MNWLRLFRVCFAALSNRSSARRLGISLFGALILAGDCVPHVRGELITFQFSGTVTSVFVAGGYGLRNFEFPHVGDSFTGFYTFDSNAPDAADSPDVGGFHTVLPQAALSVSIGATQLEGRGVVIQAIRNLAPRNYYGTEDWIPGIELTSNPALAQILNRNHFSLSIAGEDLFSDPNVLPLTPPSLVGAERHLTMTMDSGFNFTDAPLVIIRASLDSLTAVPEPSTMLIAVVVLIFSFRLRRRRNL